MKGGVSFFLYLLVVCTLGVSLRVWWGVRRLDVVMSAHELTPIRQELREIRSELEEVNRVTLKQQATLYKIEALLDLHGENRAARNQSAARETTMPATSGAEAGSAPSPPPPIDDRALHAFVQTQTIHHAEAVAGESVTTGTATFARETAANQGGGAGRQTVVFTRRGGAVTVDQPASQGEDTSGVVRPTVADALTLEDLAALVSTVSVQAANGEMASRPRETAPARARASDASQNTVERADPALPGAVPAVTGLGGTITDSVVSAAAVLLPAQPAVTTDQRWAEASAVTGGPRRVTTVPALTGEERPEVPPMRASRVARDQQAREADIASSLILSEQLMPTRGRPTRVTISDILNAQEAE